MAQRGKASIGSYLPVSREDAADSTRCAPDDADLIALGFTIIDLDARGHIVAQSSPLVDASRNGSLYDSVAREDVEALRRSLETGARGWLSFRLTGHDARPRRLRGFIWRARDPGRLRLCLQDESWQDRRNMQSDRAENLVRFGQWALDLRTGRLDTTKGLARLFTPNGSPLSADVPWMLKHCDVKERRRVKRQMINGIRAAAPFSIQCRIARGDGQRRIIETHITPECDSRGKVMALSGISRDITELSIIEKELQRLDNQHRVLMDYSNDVICQLDQQGSFLFLSAAIETMTGHKIEELVGRNISEFVHPDDIERLRTTVRQWRHNPKSNIDQYRFRGKSGEYIWVESAVRPLLDKNQRRIGLIAVVRDIRERKRAEEALVAAHERAEIANRAKTKFLANMSHELRTPLNAIIGFSEILSREMFGPLGSARYAEYVTLILESGRHLLDLINDLLDTAKIEAGRYELAREPLDIEEIVSAAVRLVQRQAETKSLKIEAPPIAIEGPVVADQRAVKQIIINLLSNAIKFTPAGGTVRVCVTEDWAYVMITVSDTGIGIPKTEVGRLARPFEQVHRDLHIAQEGTGLGLALVNSLARLHGGDIEIQSQEGIGTSVIVRLPRHAETDHAAVLG